MRTTSVLLMGMMMSVSTPGVTLAAVTVTTGKPKAGSAPANPVTIDVLVPGAPGGGYVVNVPNIVGPPGGDTPAQKAMKIAMAMAAKGLNIRFAPGAGNKFTVVNDTAGRVPIGIAVVSDPTKEVKVGLAEGDFELDGLGVLDSPFEATFGFSTNGGGLATGLDPLGDPSIVSLGIEDDLNNQTLFSVQPAPGVSFVDVFMELAQDLTSGGFPATFDPLSSAITFDDLLPADHLMIFENSDTGVGTFAAVVPEPGTLVILAPLALGASRRRLRSKEKR